LEDAADLGKGVVERIAPLQHEVAENDVDAGGCERKSGGVGADALEAAEESLMARGFVQHAGREVEGDHQRPAVAPLELRGGAAGAGAKVEDDLRSEVERLESAEEIVGYVGLEDGGGFVRCARAIEGRAHAGLVESKRIGGAALGHVCGRKSASSALSSGRCDRKGA